jgi:dihydrofolate reductase
MRAIVSQETEKIMTISVIAAVSSNGVYAQDGRLPWHSPSDMNYFKRQTIDSTVIMGLATWNSLPEKFRPLPNRQNIVISTTTDYIADGVSVVKSLQNGIREASHDNIFLIGGKRIWLEGLLLAEKLLLTVVETNIETDDGVLVCEELLCPAGFQNVRVVESHKDVILGRNTDVTMYEYSKSAH